MEDIPSARETAGRLRLAGRIDSITSREIESLFREAIMAGKRLIVADMTGVNYVSSAGLRIFISIQKELKKAGGEVCLLNTGPSVYPIFEMSGLTTIFRFLSSEDEINRFMETREDNGETKELATDKAALRVHTGNCPAGSFNIIGSEEKLPSAGYCEEDIRTVNASDTRFATGLAALGPSFEDYSGYFGETAIIDGSIFVYPALKRSAVDFIIHGEGERGSACHFLYGFSFSGKFRHVAYFEPKNDFLTLDELVDAVFSVSSAGTVGITAIFESKGLYGMRLKKVPLQKNRAEAEKDIFSGENFPEWVDYSIEPEDIYNLVIMTGIAVRQRADGRAGADRAIPEGGRCHFHGVVFDKKPFNRTINNFTHELGRIVNKMEPLRVLHLLGKTRIGTGLAGIIELDG